MLGERLIKLRKAKKWTQTELAEQCGVSRNSIVNWETGRREPKIGDIQKLAEVLNVSLNDLIGDDTPTAAANSGNDDIVCAEPNSFKYWIEVLDKARRVAENGDTQEIGLIASLLQSALTILLPTGGRLIDRTQEVTTSVSAYNGNQSHYSGNTLTLGKVSV